MQRRAKVTGLRRRETRTCRLRVRPRWALPWLLGALVLCRCGSSKTPDGTDQRAGQGASSVTRGGEKGREDHLNQSVKPDARGDGTGLEGSEAPAGESSTRGGTSEKRAAVLDAARGQSVVWTLWQGEPLMKPYVRNSVMPPPP